MTELHVDNRAFATEVWEKLSRIDVSEHTDEIPKTGKRPAISYLAWHRAWTLLKRMYPGSTYSHRKDLYHPDGSVEVEVDVIISAGGAEQMFTNARLGVMDQWFNPIQNPTSRDINDTRQRCLVKALAFAGLGLNLWSDSNIPVGSLEDPISMEQLEQIQKLLVASDSDENLFMRWLRVETLEDIPVERFHSAVGMLERKIKRAEQREKQESKK